MKRGGATSWEIRQGDCLDRLRDMPAGIVQCCVTSPPYFGLRDYGDVGQLGLEATPDEYVARLVDVFREVRRVLRDDGTVWLNIGDSYAGTWGNQGRKAERGTQRPINGAMLTPVLDGRYPARTSGTGTIPKGVDYKVKDLLGIPWLLAFALRNDGWYLRSEIVWAKPNPMPESVTDRPTSAHEKLFLLAKQPRYYYDADAVREPITSEASIARNRSTPRQIMSHATRDDGVLRNDFGRTHSPQTDAGRNRRNVWTIATQPYADAHFATFPPKLVEPCILAGSSPKACGECGAPWVRVVERMPVPADVGETNGAYSRDAAIISTSSRGIGKSRQFYREHGLEGPPSPRTVGWQPSCAHDDNTGRSVILDPFAGSGTTGLVALRHDRSFIGLELNADYCQLARRRIVDDAPLLNAIAEVAA